MGLHEPLADDGQGTRRAGDHDIVDRKLGGEVVQADRPAEETLGQLLRALGRAVCEREAARMMRREVACGKLDHLARAHEQHALLADRGIDAFREQDCRRGHGHDARADLGLAAYCLRHRKSALEHLVQQPAQRAGGLRRAHGVLELPQDLRLAQHHGIEPARHAEGVFHRLLLRQLVKIGVELLALEAVVGCGPVDGGARLGGRAIDLGAVAGGDDRRLLHRTPVDEVAQRLRQLFGMEHHLLAHRQRGSLVVDAEGEQRHVTGPG
jgi:hypothetical protein